MEARMTGIVLYIINVDESGRIENDLHRLLNKYFFKLEYRHAGSMQNTYETFSCSYQKAKEFLGKLLLQKKE